MNDHDLLELLAKGAPVAPDDCADRVIEAARRCRSRRRAVAISCAAVAAIAVLPLAALEHEGRRPARPPVAAQSVATRTTSDPARPYSAAALVYAAAVTTMVGRTAPSEPGDPVLLYDTTVPAVVSDPGSTRPGHPVPAALQAEIVALLAPRQAEFVRPGAHLRAGDGSVVRNAVVVTLGDAVIAGHSARVPIAASCGPLCGRGQTLTLERLDGTWTVTGTTGPEWIS